MAYYKYADSALPEEDGADEADTLTRRVYRTLHEEIVSGTLRPGHRLVRKTMAKRLGVSPMPVTEALYMLEIDGLVESRALMDAGVRPLRLEDVRNDQILREAIECQTARLCAEFASANDHARLLGLARQLDRMMSRGDPRSKMGMQAHLDFHMEIARAAGFASLADELQRVWFRRYMRLNWIKATQYTRVPVDWHEQLVQTISTGNIEQAEVKMREHIRFGVQDDREALQYFLQQSAGDGDGEGTGE